MESLPNNSGPAHNKETQNNVPEKPNNGVRHRPTLTKIVKDSIMPSDVDNVGEYFVTQLLIPGIRDGFFDIIQGLFDYWRTSVGGYSRGNRINVGGGNKINTQKTNYNKISTNGGYSKANANSPDRPSSYDDLFLEDLDIVVDDNTGRTKRITGISRAANCLEDCRDDIRQYGKCRVADLYQHLNMTPNYTDWNYGWVNLDNAGWVAGRGGARLVLPKALPIDEV